MFQAFIVIYIGNMEEKIRRQLVKAYSPNFLFLLQNINIYMEQDTFEKGTGFEVTKSGL